MHISRRKAFEISWSHLFRLASRSGYYAFTSVLSVSDVKDNISAQSWTPLDAIQEYDMVWG